MFLLNCFQRKQTSPSNSPSFALKANSNMKFESPSAERNKLPIWQILETKVLPYTVPLFLVIAAGAGVHTQFFAKQLSEKYPNRHFHWYPSDADVSCLNSITRLVVNNVDQQNSNVVKPPVRLTLDEGGICEQEAIDLCSLKSVDVIFNASMIHISPWEVTIGLMKVAGEKLPNETGLLVLYGPFRVNGTYSDSNWNITFLFWMPFSIRLSQLLSMIDPLSSFLRNFDSCLRQRNIRDLENVLMQAEQNHLKFIESIETSANNLVLLFGMLHESAGTGLS
jgi:Protein of unknown function (DUF938)